MMVNHDVRVEGEREGEREGEGGRTLVHHRDAMIAIIHSTPRSALADASVWGDSVWGDSVWGDGGDDGGDDGGRTAAGADVRVSVQGRLHRGVLCRGPDCPSRDLHALPMRGDWAFQLQDGGVRVDGGVWWAGVRQYHHARVRRRGNLQSQVRSSIHLGACRIRPPPSPTSTASRTA